MIPAGPDGYLPGLRGGSIELASDGNSGNNFAETPK